MAEIDNRYARMRPGARTDVAVDEGLRAYMLRVYNYMAGGVLVTGLVAYVVYSMAVTTDPALAARAGLALKRGLYLTPFGAALYLSPLKWLVMLAPLGFVLLFSVRIQKMSPASAQLLYWAFAACMGLSLSTIFIAYTHASVARVFFITAGTFAGMSLYGYTTKRDLAGMGSFMFMGLIGLILASLVNIFLQSSALQFALSVIGVVVFVGLTAWDTQRIKEMYVEGEDAATGTKKAIFGALQLYLDFINLFIMLLQLLGNRR